MKLKLLSALALTMSVSAYSATDANTVTEWNTPNTSEMVTGMFGYIAEDIPMVLKPNEAWDLFATMPVGCRTKHFDTISEWLLLYSRSYTQLSLLPNEHLIYEGKDGGRIQIHCLGTTFTIGILNQAHKMRETLVPAVVPAPVILLPVVPAQILVELLVEELAVEPVTPVKTIVETP